MAFKFNDTAPLGDNLAAFAKELDRLDPVLAPVLVARLNDFVAGVDPEGLLDELFAALTNEPGE